MLFTESIFLNFMLSIQLFFSLYLQKTSCTSAIKTNEFCFRIALGLRYLCTKSGIYGKENHSRDNLATTRFHQENKLTETQYTNCPRRKLRIRRHTSCRQDVHALPTPASVKSLPWLSSMLSSLKNGSIIITYNEESKITIGNQTIEIVPVWKRMLE